VTAAGEIPREAHSGRQLDARPRHSIGANAEDGIDGLIVGRPAVEHELVAAKTGRHRQVVGGLPSVAGVRGVVRAGERCRRGVFAWRQAQEVRFTGCIGDLRHLRRTGEFHRRARGGPTLRVDNGDINAALVEVCFVPYSGRITQRQLTSALSQLRTIEASDFASQRSSRLTTFIWRTVR